MGNHVTDLRINELIPGVGHWTQQEAPEQVNDAITRFLGML
jgi:pimeloyl-ACP methyl ester carboxylesterase